MNDDVLSLTTDPSALKPGLDRSREAAVSAVLFAAAAVWVAVDGNVMPALGIAGLSAGLAVLSVWLRRAENKSVKNPEQNALHQHYLGFRERHPVAGQLLPLLLVSVLIVVVLLFGYGGVIPT